jgi:hypothetical protein
MLDFSSGSAYVTVVSMSLCLWLVQEPPLLFESPTYVAVLCCVMFCGFFLLLQYPARNKDYCVGLLSIGGKPLRHECFGKVQHMGFKTLIYSVY